MQFTLATIAAVAGLAAAVPHSHQQFHKKDLAHDIMEDTSDLLSTLGIMKAVNAAANNGMSWVGSDGPITNTVVNKATQDITFVIWGQGASWVNVHQPLVAQIIKSGENATFSHAMGSGLNPNTVGWAAIYNDTQLVNGQISEMWGEANFVSDEFASSTYDVSMEVNMWGHNMTIEGPKCRSSPTECVFQCKDKSLKTCGDADSYELVGCETGSQPGATKGLWGNQAAGGCQGIPNTGNTNLITTLY